MYVFRGESHRFFLYFDLCNGAVRLIVGQTVICADESDFRGIFAYVAYIFDFVRIGVIHRNDEFVCIVACDNAREIYIRHFTVVTGKPCRNYKITAVVRSRTCVIELISNFALSYFEITFENTYFFVFVEEIIKICFR